MLTKTAAKAVKLICQSFNEEQVKIMKAKISKTLQNSQPEMEIYWLLQKNGCSSKRYSSAVVNDTQLSITHNIRN